MGGLARARSRGTLSEAFLGSPFLDFYSASRGSKQRDGVWRLDGEGGGAPEVRETRVDCSCGPQTGRGLHGACGGPSCGAEEHRLQNQDFVNQAFVTGLGSFKGEG